MDGTVLIADDDRTIRTVLSQALTRAGCKVHATASMRMLMQWVEEGRGDLVISDVVMPDGNGLDALPRIAALRPGLPVVIISAQNTIVTAIRATEAEAFDYLPKPFDLPDLMARVARGLERRAPRHARPVPATDTLPLIGRAPAMQALYRHVAQIMSSDLPVLITGESGTGKSLIARVLHDYSARRDAPFITLRPGDLAPDAVPRAASAVQDGTLVFDGIGDFPPDAQAQILPLLEARDGPRLLATTQRDLSEELRSDLYYRLSAIPLSLPPLRERVEDIPLLAAHFLEGDDWQLSAAALDRLKAHPWPGNLRELQNVVAGLMLTAIRPEISAGDVEDALPVNAPVEASGASLSDSVATHLQRYFDLHGAALPPPGLYARILRETEAPLLQIALEATGGNQARCADLLGINRNTLRKKLTELDIRVTRRRKLM